MANPQGCNQYKACGGGGASHGKRASTSQRAFNASKRSAFKRASPGMKRLMSLPPGKDFGAHAGYTNVMQGKHKLANAPRGWVAL